MSVAENPVRSQAAHARFHRALAAFNTAKKYTGMTLEFFRHGWTGSSSYEVADPAGASAPWQPGNGTLVMTHECEAFVTQCSAPSTPLWQLVNVDSVRLVEKQVGQATKSCVFFDVQVKRTGGWHCVPEDHLRVFMSRPKPEQTPQEVAAPKHRKIRSDKKAKKAPN